MTVTIHGPGQTLAQDHWQVWLQLEPGNPTRQQESFIVGTGPTKQAAVVDAIAELLRTADDLLRGVIEAGGVE